MSTFTDDDARRLVIRKHLEAVLDEVRQLDTDYEIREDPELAPILRDIMRRPRTWTCPRCGTTLILRHEAEEPAGWEIIGSPMFRRVVYCADCLDELEGHSAPLITDRDRS